MTQVTRVGPWVPVTFQERKPMKMEMLKFAFLLYKLCSIGASSKPQLFKSFCDFSDLAEVRVAAPNRENKYLFLAS